MQLRVVSLVAAAIFAGAPALAAPSGGGAPMSTSPGADIDPQQSFAEGIEALQEGDYKKAEKRFGEVLTVAPKHPEANYYMGLAKVGRGRDKQAVRYFKRAFEERENFVEAREQFALAQIRLGERADAEEQLAAIQAIAAACTPESCDAAYTERCAKAVAAIEAALAAPPPAAPAPDEEDAGEESSALDDPRYAWLLSGAGNGAALYRDAVRAINEGRYEAAIPALQGAQGAIGPHPDILNYLGFSHRKLARFAEARDYYGQALALDPDHLGANEYLGELYLELGDIESARRQLATLDRVCAFGCAEREDLARLIAIAESVRSAAK
jgi:tetratricopeptide (TPR) repeat protein